MNLRMNRSEAWALFGLFATQLFLNDELIGSNADAVRFYYGIGYLVLCAALLLRSRAAVPALIRDARDVIRGKADFGEEAES